MSRRRWFGAAVVGAACCLLVQPVNAQSWFSFDWNVEIESALSGEDQSGAVEVRSDDAAVLRLSVEHSAGRGGLAYALAAAAYYSPQGLNLGTSAFGGNEVVAGPVDLTVELDLPPRRYRGLHFSVAGGRLAFAEPSGLLLYNPEALVPAQRADGVRADFRYPRVYWSVGAGYLGLLDKRINRIRMSPPDGDDLLDPAVYTAPPRVLVVGVVEASSLFRRQDAGFTATAQFDARGGAEPVHTVYIGPTVGGPVIDGLRQRSSLILAVTPGADSGSAIALAGSHLLRYRIPVVIPANAWLRLEYTSGGSVIGAFPALAGPAPTDTVVGEVGAHIRATGFPAAGLWAADLALRIISAPTSGYEATEIELGVTHRPLADVGVRVDGGATIGQAGVRPFFSVAAEMAL